MKNLRKLVKSDLKKINGGNAPECPLIPLNAIILQKTEIRDTEMYFNNCLAARTKTKNHPGKILSGFV